MKFKLTSKFKWENSCEILKLEKRLFIRIFDENENQIDEMSFNQQDAKQLVDYLIQIYYPQLFKLLNLKLEMILSPEQFRVYTTINTENRPVTATQLGCSMATLQSLRRYGLIENVKQFESDEIYGHEEEKMHWRINR